MKHRTAVLFVLAAQVLVALAACSDPPANRAQENAADAATPQATAPASNGELPCEVADVVGAHCAGCHGESPTFGAPMPLVRPSDFLAPSRADPKRPVREVVRERIRSETRKMPPPPNAPLTADALELFDRWLADGAPERTGGICAKSATPARPLGQPLSCKPDQFIRPKQKLVVPNERDPYMCYGFDVSVDAKRHVVGLGPHVDNGALVHHLLLFQSPRPFSAEGAPCLPSGDPDWKLMAAWAPGIGPLETPAQAGFPEEGTTHWVLQVHYNNPNGLVGEVDASGYDLCTTSDLRKYDADVLATGTVDFVIPPRTTYAANCYYRWGAGFYGDGRDAHPKINVFGALPHMHELGRKMSAYRLTSGIRVREKIFDEGAFDFSNQYILRTDVDVEPGDLIQTRCQWENPSGERVPWGSGTSEEMCFAFLMYYPRVSGEVWNWAVPSAGRGTACYEETGVP